MSDERKASRRGFFRQLFIQGVERFEEAGQKIADQFDAIAAEDKPAYTPYDYNHNYWNPDAQRFLRPPGALPEPAFTDTCSKCGDCVKACPAQCIRLEDDKAGGLPHIVARESPCVVCTDLSCMKVCPTGALQMVEGRAFIQMGYAITDHSRCLRGEGYAVYDDETSLMGEDCRLCVTQCPMGEEALGIDGHGVVEVRHGCIGCGVCEQVCPTESPSIWVEPW